MECVPYTRETSTESEELQLNNIYGQHHELGSLFSKYPNWCRKCNSLDFVLFPMAALWHCDDSHDGWWIHIRWHVPFQVFAGVGVAYSL